MDIDERDLKELDVHDEDIANDQTSENKAECPVIGDVRRSTADKVVKVATIDTFQGCEADIVILCTVRNQGLDDSSGQGSKKKTIGFLKVCTASRGLCVEQQSLTAYIAF